MALGTKLGIIASSGVVSFTNTYSLDFDGVDDYVSIPTITLATDFSVSMWLKLAAIGTTRDQVFGGTSGFFWLGTVVYSGGLLANKMCYINGATAVALTPTLRDGNWHNIVITYNSSATNLIAYTDGVETYNATYDAGTNNVINRISEDTYGNHWKGNLDELAVWTSELSQSDVTSIYGGGVPSSLSSLNPLAWYRNGDNGSWKSPQWLIPNNENKDKVSNYSLDFDGVDDYVGLGNPTDLQITGAFSFSCWVNTTSTNYEGIYFKGNSVALNDIYIRRQNNGTVRMFVNGSSINVTSSTTVNDGSWHHIMCVYVPSTSMTIYIDGSQDAQNTTSIPSAINNNYGNISIGQGGGQFFNGKIDEASIFNTDQSANISSIYNGGIPTTITGAIAHYKMGEEATFSGGVWTVPDSVGSNNGTSANMTIEDRIGEAPNSENNALSLNMDEVDRVEDVPS